MSNPEPHTASPREHELEQALLRSEERYLVAARAAGFAIWDWVLADEQLHWSRNVEGLLGHPLDSLSTFERWLEHVHVLDRGRVAENIRHCVDSGQTHWSDTFQFLKRDGTWASMLARCWILHDATGNAVRIVGGFIDVTRERQLSQRLEEQVHLTRTVAENAASCLFLLDGRGFVTYMNAAAVRVTGYTPEELGGVSVHALLSDGWAVPPSGGDGQARRVRDLECMFVRKDGARLPVSCCLTPLLQSEPGSAVLEFRDISDLKRSQHELREAIRVRDDFLSIASHELRTPLTALQLQVQGMTRGALYESFDEHVRVRLRGAERSIGRMVHLVDELLDVSRLNAGGLALELAEIDLVEVIRSVVERMQPDIQRSACPISLALPERIEGEWDRARIDQVFCNLLSNALKYGERKPVGIAAWADDRQAGFSVRDAGIGIAPEQQRRIFERFERAVSQSHYGGFGLGLWIVRRVLDAMGGTVRVESTVGAGALFEVIIPRRQQTKSPHGADDGQGETP